MPSSLKVSRKKKPKFNSTDSMELRDAVERSQFLQKSNEAGTYFHLIFHHCFLLKFTGKFCIHPWRTSHRKGKIEREHVKTKVRYAACSFSVHCVHFRGRKVSMQLHAKQFEDGYISVISVNSLHCVKPLQVLAVGYCDQWHNSARQGHSITSASWWIPLAWSCKGELFLTLDAWCRIC